MRDQCSRCGEQLKVNQVFCVRCGARVGNNQGGASGYVVNGVNIGADRVGGIAVDTASGSVDKVAFATGTVDYVAEKVAGTIDYVAEKVAGAVDNVADTVNVGADMSDNTTNIKPDFQRIPITKGITNPQGITVSKNVTNQVMPITNGVSAGQTYKLDNHKVAPDKQSKKKISATPIIISIMGAFLVIAVVFIIVLVARLQDAEDENYITDNGKGGATYDVADDDEDNKRKKGIGDESDMEADDESGGSVGNGGGDESGAGAIAEFAGTSSDEYKSEQASGLSTGQSSGLSSELSAGQPSELSSRDTFSELTPDYMVGSASLGTPSSGMSSPGMASPETASPGSSSPGTSSPETPSSGASSSVMASPATASSDTLSVDIDLPDTTYELGNTESVYSGGSAPIFSFSDNAEYNNGSSVEGMNTTSTAEQNNVSKMILVLDKQYVTRDDLLKFSLDDLGYLRNGIFALSGKIFLTEKYRTYFNAQNWYNGTITSDSETTRLFNDYQKKNLNVIIEYEKELGGRQ